MAAVAADARDEAHLEPYPRRAYAWFVVAVLTAAYAASMLDRWVLSLVVQPVKAHFGLSDTQMGLLMGPAFAMCYIVMGLPFGWVADRSNRRNLIVGALGFWCLMTASCGLARNAAQLTFARFGIGIGEAALSPAANSIIADYFPRRLQSRAIGVFNVGIYAGMGLSYLIGGLIVGWAAGRVLIAPGLGRLESWQLVFLLVGAPGLALGVLMLFVAEPKRRGPRVTAETASMGACFAYMRRHLRTFGSLAVGMGAAPLVGYTNTWLPAMFTRTWHWPASQFSVYYGLILLILGPLGAVASGVLAARINATGRRDGSMICAIVGLAVYVLCGTLTPQSPSPILALLLLTPGAFAGSLATSAGVAATVFATPSAFRGRILASYTIINGTIGVFAGPALVGLLSDHLFVGPTGIRYAMSAVLFGVGGALVLLLSSGRKAYDRTVLALESA